MRANPIFSPTWPDPDQYPGSKYKKGQRVSLRITLQYPSGPMPVGSIGTVENVVKSLDTGRYGYEVKFDDGRLFYMYELELNPVHTPMQDNPIYPDDWQHRDLQAGDEVVVDFSYLAVRGSVAHNFRPKGVVTCITAAGSTRIYDVRLEDGKMLYSLPISLLTPTGNRRKYRNNPIYPREWKGPRKFTYGDFLKSKRTDEIFLVVNIEVIRDVEYFALKSTDGQHSYRYLTEETVEKYFKKIMRDNPVRPSEWRKGPWKFSNGDYLRWKGGQLAFKIIKVTVVNDVPIFSLKQIDGTEYYPVLSEHAVDKFFEKIVPPYEINPVYPREWSDPKFKVGERVMVFDKTHDLYLKMGTIINISGLMYYVDFPHIGKKNVFHEMHLKRVRSYMRNPIFPDEWHGQPKFKKGDVVIGKSGIHRGMVGTIRNIIEEPSGKAYYRIDFPSQMVPGSFSDTLREEWLQLYTGKFREGDTVQVMNPARKSWYRRRGRIIRIVPWEHPDDEGKYLYICRFGKSLSKPNDFVEGDLQLIDRYQQNPVYPEQWSLTPPFAVGERVVIFDDGNLKAYSQMFSYLFPLIGRQGIVRRIYKLKRADKYRYDVMLDGEVETTSVPQAYLRKAD